MRRVVPAVLLLTVTLVAACDSATVRTGLQSSSPAAPSRSTVQPATTTVSRTTCGQPTPVPVSGAPSSLGFTVGHASAPRWSESLWVQAATGEELLAQLSDKCVTAVSPATGRQLWSVGVPKGLLSLGVLAAPKIVLEALGEYRGHAPAMVYSTTTRLVGLDPATGSPRWSLNLADDGQDVPAVVIDNVVVVAEADGTVLGLDEATGHQRWSDSVPAGCTVSAQGGQLRGAAVVSGVDVGLVAYLCATSQQVLRIDPATGARVWSLTLKSGNLDQYPTAAGPAGGAIGLLVDGGFGSPGVRRVTAPPGSGGGYLGDSLITVDANTGKELWRADGVSGSGGVYAGAGHLCTVSGFGIGCYAARTGVESWHLIPPAVPSNGGPGGPDFLATVEDSGRLYTVLPTAGARAIPGESTTYRSAPGTFHLDVLDMADGQVLTDVPLPAYYGGPDGVVASADTPPGVYAVAAGIVIVSPQVSEAGAVEAFDVPQ